MYGSSVAEQKRKHWAGRLLLALLLVTTAARADHPNAPVPEHEDLDYALLLDLPDEPLSFTRRIRPLLDRRCVVCHGCYDAPCQLKLSSMEGLRRGASKARVYDPARLEPAQPTRLFVDAKSVAGWRALGFHPVLNEGERTPGRNLSGSVLYKLLRLKQLHPQPRTGRLPPDYTLELNREQVCATAAGFSDYAREHPAWGMPYAMPNLADDDYRDLVHWIAQGAPAPPPPGPSPAARAQIEHWEDFLNGTDNKQRLVSRYLYEHLFHAHLHFEGTPTREFYRLVRSTTPPGQPVDEIATVRPYDDPGRPRFYYRLVRHPGSIVAKRHLVYALSERRLQRLRELFIEPDYRVAELPSYRPGLASNPFKTFAAIPPGSRYRFLLDDAHFFIEGFVKGPVCRGQVALSVIEDRFWVLFFDPDRPIFTSDPAFLGRVADDLQLPADARGSLDVFSLWTDYWKRERRYMEAKQAHFRDMPSHRLDHALGFLWDGDGENPNAALTVFRHFDSASVAWGLVGDEPETTWFIDYPLFERIHYLLVAGFNVYGNLVHQLNTRVYMDFLRMEGEDYFLAFLPAGERRALRRHWYRGLRREVQRYFREPLGWLSVDVVTGYRSERPQQELYSHLRARLAPLAARQAAMNRCGGRACRTRVDTAAKRRADRAMQRIAQKRGAALHAFPELAFVRVRTGGRGPDLVYTVIRNKAYRNVSSLFSDQRERDRADIAHDTLTVVDWLEGAYPNFFFEVDLEDMDAFGRQCAAIGSYADYGRFVAGYGARRTRPDFWRTADWFQDRLARDRPLAAGILDLSRYRNR